MEHLADEAMRSTSAPGARLHGAGLRIALDDLAELLRTEFVGGERGASPAEIFERYRRDHARQRDEGG